MDITLFSKCLKSMVLEHDSVCIPGLGTFFVQLEEASFSDRGTILYPPCRKLSFRDVEQGDTMSFIERLAPLLEPGCNAAIELAVFVEKVKDSLFGKRSIRINGLGTLKTNAKQVIFFVADDALDIYPGGFGLKPVEVNALKEDSTANVVSVHTSEAVYTETPATVPEKEKNVVDAPETGQTSTEMLESAAQTSADKSGTVQEKMPEPVEKKRHTLLWIFIISFIIGVVAAVAAYIFKDTPWVSNLLDELLYTEEELQLIKMF